MNDIIVSVKPKYCDLIKEEKKFNEFRNFIPKRGAPQNMWIYETAPVSSLRYLMRVDEPIKYPEKVTERGYSDIEFNKGDTKYKIAYPIISLYELSNPIKNKDLLDQYNLKGPQAYVYLDTYPLLKEVLTNIELIKRI